MSKVKANNTTTAVHFYVEVEGKKGLQVFASDVAKQYYVSCMQQAEANSPIKVRAFSISANTARVIVDSYDQAPGSCKSFFESVAEAFCQYFSEVNSVAGAVLRKGIKIKSVKKENVEQYANILTVDGQLPKELNFITKKAKFNDVMDCVLADYKVKDVRAISNDVMHRIIAEVSERGNFKFDYIVKKIGLGKKNRYEMLLKVVVELVVNLNLKYDSALNNLGVSFETREDARELLVDTIYMINNWKGYAFDYILGMMGLRFPNEDLLADVVNEICYMQNCSIAAGLKKLGIITELPERHAYIQAKYPNLKA